MADAKKIAVIVRDRPAEALRVAGGLTLADDTIEVIVLDTKLDKENPEIAEPLEQSAIPRAALKCPAFAPYNQVAA